MAVALTATAVVGGAVEAAPTAAPTAEQGPGTAHHDRGSWQVRALGAGRYDVSWTSPGRLPVTSDRPTIVGSRAMSISAPTIGADQRTVHAVVTADATPTSNDFDVLLSGDRLDAPGDDRRSSTGGPTGSGRQQRPHARELSADPGAPGDLETVSSDYQLAPVKVSGMREPIEMIGHVVEPAADAATGPRPLVLFLHGRHDYCYNPTGEDGEYGWPCQAPFQEIPSHLGYDYIQQVLASQGFTTVSVRVNGINAQDFRLEDGGAGARATIVQAHLDHWTTIADEHQVDLSQVVLVGHSRGGEGVNRASIRIPLDAPYRIVGQVLIAPTDFAAQTAPYVPTVTLLPYCDGDVSDLQGQKFTDAARDIAADDTSLKSSVMVMGANHNFFNTEWTPGVAVAPSFDDWYGGKKEPCGKRTPERLSAAEQRSVGQAYVTGAVRLFTGEQEFLPMFDGSQVTVPSIGDAQVLSHAIGGGRDERRPGVDTSLSLADGAQTQFCNGVVDFQTRYGACGRNMSDFITPHWPGSYEKIPTRRAFEMLWEHSGESGGMLFATPLDLSTGRLELRTIVDPRIGDVQLGVRVTDLDGASAELTPMGAGNLTALLRGAVTKVWAQTLVVEPAGASGVDLTRISRVDLIGKSDRGRVWVADLAAAPATLAPVPDRRAPVVNLSAIRIDEGDRKGSFTARVPFRVTGDLSRPGRLVVVTAGQARGSVQRFTIDLAPGQSSGSVPIEYTADDRDDLTPYITTVSAWATRDLMTDSYLGALTVDDDDPTPPITITAVDKTITEGESAEWKLRIDRWVDYELYVSGRVVRGPRPVLRGADVPLAWLQTHAWPIDPAAPLQRLNAFVFEELRPGGKSVVVSLPTLKDGVAERRESVTVLFNIDGQKFRRTVYVAPSG
ncbi:MAG: secreted protein [Nocardioides sp.]|nr:secreted protein [Nocardioides sp.]